MILRLLLILPLLIQSVLCVTSAKIQSINVNCEEDGMGVDIQFDQAFHGVIFSKNFFSSPGCNYINNPGQDKVHFTIKAGQCGTVMGPPANGAALGAKRTRRDTNHTMIQVGNHTFNISDLRQARSDMFGMDFGKMDGMFGGMGGGGSNGYENSREDMPPPEAMEFMQQPNQQQTPGQQLPQQNVPQLSNGPDQTAHLAGHEVASLGSLPQPQFQGQVPLANVDVPNPNVQLPNAPLVGQLPAAEGDRIQNILTQQANTAQQPLMSAVGNVNGLYNNYPVNYNTPPKVMTFGSAPNPPSPPNPMGSYNLQNGLQAQLPPGANQMGNQYYQQQQQPNYQQSPYANVGYGNQYASNAGTPSGAYQVPSNSLDAKYDDDSSTTTGAPEEAYAFPTVSSASDAERLTGRSGNYDSQGQVYNVPGFNADASTQYGSPVPNAQYLGGGGQAMGRQYDGGQQYMPGMQNPPQVPQMPSYQDAPQGMLPPSNPVVPDYPAAQQGPPMYPNGPNPMDAPYSPGVPSYPGGPQVPNVPPMQAPDMGNYGGGMPQMPQPPSMPQMDPYAGMQQGNYGQQNSGYNSNNMGGYGGNSGSSNNGGNVNVNRNNDMNNNNNRNNNNNANLNSGSSNQAASRVVASPSTARTTVQPVTKTNKKEDAESGDYDESDEGSFMISSTVRGGQTTTTRATARRQATTTLSDDDDNSLQVSSSTSRAPVTVKAKTTTASLADDDEDEDVPSPSAMKQVSSNSKSSSGSSSSSSSGTALSKPSLSHEDKVVVKSHPLPDQLPRLRAILRDTHDKKFTDASNSGGSSGSSSSSGDSGFAGNSATADEINASLKKKPAVSAGASGGSSKVSGGGSSGGDNYDTKYDNQPSEPAFGYNEPKNQYDSRRENIGGDQSAGGREPAFGYHEPSGPGEPKFQYNEPADQYREPSFGYKEPQGQFNREPAFGYREPTGPGEPKFQYNEPAGRFNQEPGFGYHEPGDRYEAGRDNGGSEPSFGYHEPGFGYNEPKFGYREPTGGVMPENGGAFDRDLSGGPGRDLSGGPGGAGSRGSYSPGTPARGGGAYGGGQVAQGGYGGGQVSQGGYAGGNSGQGGYSGVSNSGQGSYSNGNGQTASDNGQNAQSKAVTGSNGGVSVSGGASANSGSSSGSAGSSNDAGNVISRNNQAASGSASGAKVVGNGGNAVSLPATGGGSLSSGSSSSGSSSSGGKVIGSNSNGKSLLTTTPSADADDDDSDSGVLGSGLTSTTKKWGKGWSHKSKSGSSDDDSYGDDTVVAVTTQKPTSKAKAQEVSGGSGQQNGAKASGLASAAGSADSGSSGTGQSGGSKAAVSVPSRGSQAQSGGGLSDIDDSENSSFKQSGQSSSQNSGQSGQNKGSGSQRQSGQSAKQSGVAGNNNGQAAAAVKSSQNSQQAANDDAGDQENKVISGVKKTSSKADSAASADSLSNRGSVDTSDGGYIENVIIIQNDPLVQEVWDAARAIRCEWRSNYKKTVSTKERIALTEVQTMRFAGDDIEVWMEIQAGKGPWADPVSNIVPIGHTMTLLIGANDPKHEFDLRVGRCVAHDGGKSQIELTDDNGCVVRDRIMGKFDKAKDWGAEHATIAFAHFSAFKFPETTKVFIECDVEVCKKGCTDMCSSKGAAARSDAGKGKMVSVNSKGASSGAVTSKATGSRQKRNVKSDKDTLSVKTHYDAISPADLSFNVDIHLPPQNGTIITYAGIRQNTDQYCMSRGGFGVGLGILLTAVLVASLSSVFLCLRYKNQRPLFLN